MKRLFTLFHLDSERGLRGGERQLLYLAAHLERRGHENVVVCRRGAPLDREAERLGLDVLHLPFLGEWDPLSAWMLRRAASCARRTPLLHAHTAHTAALAWLATRLGGPLWVAHRRVDFKVNGSLSLRLKYDGASKVVAVSGFVRKTLTDAGLDGSKVAVVPDCLPIDEEEARAAGLDGGPLAPPSPREAREARRRLSQEHGLPADGVWIGNLAALVPHKDQATLIRSVPRVLRDLPAARFILIGGGPLLGELKALARSEGVESAVRFTGRVGDVRPWLKSLDLYVQSSWGEGMGSVLLEVMASRVPIVATTAGGIPEVVEDGKTALLAPPRDPGKLSECVLSALMDRKAAERRAEEAVRTLKGFSLTALGDRALRVYEEVGA